MKTKNEYKARAKKLGNAISSILNVDVTNSQGLELVAKEENFPNWDALVGCLVRNVDVATSSRPTGRNIFSPMPKELIDSILNQKRGIVVISGQTGCGKTTIMNEAFKFARQSNIASELIDEMMMIRREGRDDLLIKTLQMLPDILFVDEVREFTDLFWNCIVSFAQNKLLVISTHGRDEQGVVEDFKKLRLAVRSIRVFMLERTFIEHVDIKVATTVNYWDANAAMLAAKLGEYGETFIASASLVEIESKADNWFTAKGDKEKASIVAVMRANIAISVD